jgi:hypothetical protein
MSVRRIKRRYPWLQTMVEELPRTRSQRSNKGIVWSHIQGSNRCVFYDKRSRTIGSFPISRHWFQAYRMCSCFFSDSKSLDHGSHMSEFRRLALLSCILSFPCCMTRAHRAPSNDFAVYRITSGIFGRLCVLRARNQSLRLRSITKVDHRESDYDEIKTLATECWTRVLRHGAATIP